MPRCCPALPTPSVTQSSRRRGGLRLQELDQRRGEAAGSWGKELWAETSVVCGEQMVVGWQRLRWKARSSQERVVVGLAAMILTLTAAGSEDGEGAVSAELEQDKFAVHRPACHL